MSTARFEAFDHSELEEIQEKDQTGNEPARILMTREAVNALLQEAQTALAGINAVQDELQVKTSKIDQQLKTHIISERTMSLRREYQPLIDAHMDTIRKAAATANEQRKFWNPRSVRARASFDDDTAKDATIRLAWIKRLEKAHHVFMEEMAAFAVATNSLALAHTIETELDAREGQLNECTKGERQAAMRLINSIPNASVQVLGIIDQINNLQDVSKMAASGKVDPQTLIRSGLRTAGAA